MAKLYQHQTDGTYYTRTYEGGIVTRQIHPHGVAYLKHCGVRVDGEIPSYCMSELRDYGWLFTKEEMPFWGETDWSPHWSRIQPRPLSQLRPVRRNPSVAEWRGVGGDVPASSVADEVEDRLVDVQARIEQRRQQMLRSIQAEIETVRRELAQVREAGQVAAEDAGRQRKEEARERNRLLREERARKRREAALKGAETRRRNRATRGRSGVSVEEQEGFLNLAAPPATANAVNASDTGTIIMSATQPPLPTLTDVQGSRADTPSGVPGSVDRPLSGTDTAQPGWSAILSPEVKWTTQMWIWFLVLMVMTWPIDRRIFVLLLSTLVVYKIAGSMIRTSRIQTDRSD